MGVQLTVKTLMRPYQFIDFFSILPDIAARSIGWEQQRALPVSPSRVRIFIQKKCSKGLDLLAIPLV
jgi:hypothetical protein